MAAGPEESRSWMEVKAKVQRVKMTAPEAARPRISYRATIPAAKGRMPKLRAAKRGMQIQQRLAPGAR